jgi:hypothetical protein
MRCTMSRIELSRPPGVSSCSTSSAAPFVSAAVIARST